MTQTLKEIINDSDISNKFAITLQTEDKAAIKKYLQGVYNVWIQSPALQKCSPQSIIKAAITAAELKLPIDARQYAYLIPYGSNAQIQVSSKGLTQIVKRDPDVDQVRAVLVYEGDEFSVDAGENKIIHKVNLDSGNYGKDEKIRYAYAIITFKSNTYRDSIFEVMTRQQIDSIKAISKSGGGIWSKFYGEMARKTVKKRLCKHAQIGDVEKALIIDNASEQGKVINLEDGQYVEEQVVDEEKEKAQALTQQILKGGEK